MGPNSKEKVLETNTGINYKHENTGPEYWHTSFKIKENMIQKTKSKKYLNKTNKN